MENTIVYDAVQGVKSSVEYYGGGHIKPRRGYSKQCDGVAGGCDDVARQGLREVGAARYCIRY